MNDDCSVVVNREAGALEARKVSWELAMLRPLSESATDTTLVLDASDVPGVSGVAAVRQPKYFHVMFKACPDVRRHDLYYQIIHLRCGMETLQVREQVQKFPV